MFGPSVKSVPGWWVSIVPMLIGVPVALTPGLGPQDDVSVEPPVLALAAEVLLDAALLLELLLLLLLLLPHPASTIRPMTAVSARDSRTRGTCPYNPTFSSSS
jgi:hypothetical protein